MLRRTFITAASAAVFVLGTGALAQAQDGIKIGLILPMTGPFASTGHQIKRPRNSTCSRMGTVSRARRFS